MRGMNPISKVVKNGNVLEQGKHASDYLDTWMRKGFTASTLMPCRTMLDKKIPIANNIFVDPKTFDWYTLIPI